MNAFVRAFGVSLCFVLLASLSRAEPEMKRVVMQLDWIYNAQFSGLYAAIEKGYFAEVGIEVELRPVDRSEATVDLVLEEELPSFGSAESNVLIKARAAGAEVKALATMFQGSPMGWMFLEESGIKGVQDFSGKHIGVHADGVSVVGLAMSREGLDVGESELELVGYDVGILLRGEVDILQGYYIDEYVKIQTLTEKPVGMILAKDHGYSTYSQVVFCPETLIESEPQLVGEFLSALKRGWEYALAHQEETIALLLEKYNPDLDADYQLKSLAKIENLVKPDGQPALSPMDSEVWREAQRQFLENKTLSEPIDLDEFLDQSFNP